MISVMARNSDGSSGSPSITVALTIPSSGVASSHSDVVTAGRLRLTTVIAQLANAVQTIPLNSNRQMRRPVHAICGGPSTTNAITESSAAASSTCQNTS